jgi:hypothetical protein
MAAPEKLVRDEVYSRIALKKGVSGFSENNFELVRAHQPRIDVKDIGTQYPNGVCFVVALGAEENRNRSRGTLHLTTVPVWIQFTKLLRSESAIAEGDLYIDLLTEIKDCVRNDFALAGYQWVTHVVPKDDSETPYSYVSLRRAGLFEGVFISRFLTTRS